MKQLSDRMRDQRLQVADRVRKHVAAARILPKVVSTAGLPRRVETMACFYTPQLAIDLHPQSKSPVAQLFLCFPQRCALSCKSEVLLAPCQYGIVNISSLTSLLTQQLMFSHFKNSQSASSQL